MVIIIHATLAILAVPLGLFIFSTQKGTGHHKFLGKIWITCLAMVSVTAIFIQEITPGEYSFIHLLIPVTLITLVVSIWSIRRFKQTKIQKYRKLHMISMINVYIGALVIAGLFTLTPGRIFHQFIFG